MLQDPAVGVVVITTIPTSHFEICKLALEHGKHVIVEKPFTPTAREAGALIASAQKCDRLLSVYQNRRWDADFLTLRKLLDEKRLGRVVEFESHFDRYRPIAPSAAETWKAKPLPGGGVLYDLGSHLIDQVLVLFGTPERITGFVGSQREGGVEDWFTVMLHYEAGFVATVKAGCLSAEVDQLRFWLRGVGGSYWKVCCGKNFLLRFIHQSAFVNRRADK